MSVCTSGQSRRYKWTKTASKKTSKAAACVSVIKDYFKYNTRHATDALLLLDDETILFYAEQLGRQLDEIKVIKKELKAR